MTEHRKLGVNLKNKDGDLYDRKEDSHELYNLSGRPEVSAVEADPIQRIVAFALPLGEILRHVGWVDVNQRPFTSSPVPYVPL